MDNKKLEQDINDMVESLEKSNTVEETAEAKDYADFLNEVKTLGKDEVQKSYATMTPEQQETFRSILTKAIEFDKEATTRQPTFQNESEAVNRQQDKQKEDEKLMKEKAAEHKHQGDNSVLEGQVIKAKEMKEEKKEPKSEDKDKEDKKESKKHEKNESKKHEEKEEKEEKVEKAAKPEPKKEEKKEEDKPLKHEIYSDDMVHRMMGRAMEKGLSKYKMLGALEKKGYDMKKCEGMWSKNQESYEKKMQAAMKKSVGALEAELNALVPQEALPQAEIEARAKMQSNTQAVDEMTGEMIVAPKAIKKSIQWSNGTQDLLKSKSLGRNATITVEEIIHAKPSEDKIAKSKNDSLINDILEANGDRTECEVRGANDAQDTELKKSKTVRDFGSYSIADMAKMCNVSEQDAELILKGEFPPKKDDKKSDKKDPKKNDKDDKKPNFFDKK